MPKELKEEVNRLRKEYADLMWSIQAKERDLQMNKSHAEQILSQIYNLIYIARKAGNTID